MRAHRLATTVAPEPAPTEPAEVDLLWCDQSLWDEGEFWCERPAHQPGTSHWYDIRKASQARRGEIA